MQYRWILRPMESPDLVEVIRRSLNDLPEALARALVLRGIDSFERARMFFRPSQEALHDPFIMADMLPAAERVARALREGDRILVYGDYDVDGTTATALLVSALRSLGGDVSFFVPDRFEDGYGLGVSGLDHAAERGVGLIISVDCGVTATEEARHARELGIDLIVCDHHTPGVDLPEAVAVLDAKRADCGYPFKELCGCAMAFKLLQAVLSQLGRPVQTADRYLDLVAVATASDIVPVTGENRILLSVGLEALRTRARLGLRKLAEGAGLSLETCTPRDLVFVIGPRLNAAGRLSSAEKAVALLLAEDEAAAANLASELEDLNRRRRSIDQDTLKAAETLAERQITSGTRHSIVLHQQDWHLGVVGIVASRLVDRFYKPCILLGTNNGVAKGSARSIAGINVYDALCACRDLLIEFGGHDHAAGMSLSLDNVPALQRRFDEAVGSAITPDLLQPALHVDAHVDLDEIDSRFWAVLKQFAPFGPNNDRPVFQANQLRLTRPARTVGRDGKHLKFSVCNGSAASMGAIGFGLGDRAAVLEKSWRSGTPVDVLFSLDENTWNGRTTLQLRAKDLRLSTMAG